MEYLPAIYQRAEAEPGSFLRNLVGVLEATTQTLDGEIGAMGSKIDPDTAPVPWLNYVARWIGLPWDDALDETQKRALVKRANEIATKRGTRAGLEALLDCLMPGQPPRYRVIDFTSEYSFATVGGCNLPRHRTAYGAGRVAVVGARARSQGLSRSRAFALRGKP